MKKMACYFDHAATTPVDPAVSKAMAPYFFDTFGNPASVHSFGRAAVAAVDRARQQVADFLGAKPLEVIFTSGATESNNLAIRGLVSSGQHLITTTIEHPAVLEVCQHLEKQGVTVTYSPVNRQGLISVDGVLGALTDTTRLISVMYVNNELGTIQPIAALGNRLAIINQDRRRRQLPPVYLHTDAAQAAFYCDCNVDNLGVDLLSFSGHKIYGPKGIGALYRRTDTPLEPILWGGPQEFHLRPGTLNVAAVVGLAAALKLVEGTKHQREITRIKKLRDRLVGQVEKQFPAVRYNGDRIERVAGNAHFSFLGVAGQQLLIILDQAGIAVSVGSACSAGSLEPSHVLAAIGLDQALASGSLRVTLGRGNSAQQVNYFVKILSLALAQLRS
jgi:cysteine desulfurase